MAHKPKHPDHTAQIGTPGCGCVGDALAVDLVPVFARRSRANTYPKKVAAVSNSSGGTPRTCAQASCIETGSMFMLRTATITPD